MDADEGREMPNATEIEMSDARDEPEGARPAEEAAKESDATSQQAEASPEPTEPTEFSESSESSEFSEASSEPTESSESNPPGEQPAVTEKLVAAAPAESADITSGSEAEEGAESASLTPGQVIAGFLIERQLREEDGVPIYAATPENPETNADTSAPAWRHTVRQVPQGKDTDRLAHLVAMGVRGPGLLAPVALAREDGRMFLVSVEFPGEGGEPAAPLGRQERLRPVDALTAGAQLAEALTTLHRNGLAHLHVSPERVILFDGRVYLSGIEDATIITDQEDGPPLFARDANFLARTIGALGGVADAPLWERDSSAQRSLREIAARGEARGFSAAEEVAETCSLALQALLVAGAQIGADVRAVRLRIEGVGASSVGRVRSENQDAWAVTQFTIHDDAAADAPLGVYVIADGMGGEARGEIASRLVVRVVAAEMARRFLTPQSAWPAKSILSEVTDTDGPPQAPLTQALEEAVKEANRQTRAFGARLNATTGSTVTALAIAGARAALAHLGDSRAYLLRENQLLQLTEDHSLLARLEAINSPLLEDPSFMVPRSVLYRSIGQDDDVAPDMLQFVLAPGDRLVLCSDGLWDELSPEVIGQAITEASDPQSCANRLVSLANASGGHDNSTAVVIFVSAIPADDPFELGDFVTGGAPADETDETGDTVDDTSAQMGDAVANDGEAPEEEPQTPADANEPESAG